MNDIHENDQMGRFARRMVAVLCAAALFSTLCIPTQAWAYFSKPAVGIYFGSSAISLTTGSSSSVALTIDPSSESQLPGCGMSICPQACNGLETPEGVMGGCLNEAGWCTCGGTGYYTEYTQVTVSSSNPYVARASASGGALSIQALSPGTATITVYATLAKHVDTSASMTVTVSDPAPSSSDTSSGGGSTGGSSGGSTGGAGGGSTGGGSGTGSGTVSVTAAGSSATSAAAAAASASGGDDKVVELQTEDGKKVIVAKATDAASAAEELKKVAGTEGTVTFWSGGTLDAPSISWTFKGSDLSADADLNIDPTVQVSRKGTDDVATLLTDVKSAIVMDFAHSGKLPATAEVYVRASGVYEDGSKVNLYTYNEDERKFELVQEDIEVKDGYAVYSIDHCSTWALSDEDLTACEFPVDDSSDVVAANEVDVHAKDGTPYIIGGIAAAVVVAAAVAVVLVRRKRAGAIPVDAAGEGGMAGDAAAAMDGAPDEDASEEYPVSPSDDAPASFGSEGKDER